MREYHIKWLAAHQDRTAEWLSERLKDGFDIHHIDGNALNNEPSNLVLIEHQDHMGLHQNGGLGFRQIKFKYKRPIGPPSHRLESIVDAQLRMKKQLDKFKRQHVR